METLAAGSNDPGLSAGVPACRIGLARQATRLPYKFDDVNGADGKSQSAEFA
jgi:hypothetical protein